MGHCPYKLMNNDIWTNLLRQMFVVQIATRIFRKFTHNADFSLCVQSLPFIWYFSVCWSVIYLFQRWALQPEWLETTQPALLMTSPGVRDHTANSAEEQPRSQGPHSQLCWGPAWESGTTQPALLGTSPGVRDHTASSAEDQRGSQGAHSQFCWGPTRESGSTQPVMLRTSAGFRDHTANSVEEQPRSKGPHSQLCWGTDWESRTAWPTLLRNNLGVRDHSPLIGSTHWRIKVIFR